MQISKNSKNALLACRYLRNKDFRGFDFEKATFLESDLSGTNFENAFLVETRLVKAMLVNCNLKKVNAPHSHFTGANLSLANLTNANLKFACFREAYLGSADLSGADLSNSDLSGANLTGANLNGTIGLGSRTGEVEFANWLLAILKSGRGKLEMSDWHTCDTTHCLAGWRFPKSANPAAEASRLYPTLALYFYNTTNEEALEALELVGAGKLSVFPD